MNLLTAQEVDSIFRYPNGRTARLARAGKIPCIKLPDGEFRFDEATLDQILTAKIHNSKKESPTKRMIRRRRRSTGTGTR
jgi:hypothetical protein